MDLTNLAPIANLPPIGERKRLRELFGVSQAQIATSIGVTRKTIGKWEKGEWEPTGGNREAYAAILEAWRNTEIQNQQMSADENPTT